MLVAVATETPADVIFDMLAQVMGTGSRLQRECHYVAALGSPDPVVRRALADALVAAVPGIVAELTKE